MARLTASEASLNPMRRMRAPAWLALVAAFNTLFLGLPAGRGPGIATAQADEPLECAPEPSPSECTVLGSIGGKVVDPVTGETVFGVRVTARTGQLVYTAQTNDQGAYSIQGIPAGTYAVRFSRPVNYAFQPNPFPDFNYSPEPLVVNLPCGKNVIDADLKNFHHYGVKVPSIMECGGQPCGWKVSVYDFDDPATATDPNCGTDACDGPEDFNRNPTDKIFQIIETGYTLRVIQSAPAEVVRKTTFSYDQRGQILRIDGPRGDIDDIIDFIYYPMSNPQPQARGRLRSIGRRTHEQFSLVWEILEYDSLGNHTIVRYPNGFTSTVLFNSDGLPINGARNDGASTEYFYDNNSLLSYVRLGDGTFLRVERGTDFISKQLLMTLSDFPFVGGQSNKTVAIDGSTVESRIENSVGDSRRILRRIINSFEVETLDPDSSEILWTYKTNPTGTVLISRPGHEERPAIMYSLDQDARVLRIDGPINSSEDFAQIFSYDRMGNLSERRDAEDQRFVYSHDDFGRLSAIDSLEAGSLQFEYDLSGNIAKKVDSRNMVIEYTTDAVGRLTKATSSHGPDLPTDVVESVDPQYIYDIPIFGNCPMCSNGRLTRIVDNLGLREFRHDILGRLSEERMYALGMENLPYFLTNKSLCGFGSYLEAFDAPLKNHAEQMVDAEACPEIRFSTKWEYDELDRVQKETLASGTVIRYYRCGENGSRTTPIGEYIDLMNSGEKCAPGQVVRITATVPHTLCDAQRYCPTTNCPQTVFCPDPNYSTINCPRDLRRVPRTGWLNPPPSNPDDITSICGPDQNVCITLGECHPANWMEQTIAENIIWFPENRISRLTYGDGYVVSINRDSRGRVVRVSDRLPGCDSGISREDIHLPLANCDGPLTILGARSCRGNNLSNICKILTMDDYGYNGLPGQAELITDIVQYGGNQTAAWHFEYDSLNRLVLARRTGEDLTQTQFDYAYDRTGLRTMANGVWYGIDRNHSRIENDGVGHVEYNARGNVVRDAQGNAFSYDTWFTLPRIVSTDNSSFRIVPSINHQSLRIDQDSTENRTFVIGKAVDWPRSLFNSEGATSLLKYGGVVDAVIDGSRIVFRHRFGRRTFLVDGDTLQVTRHYELGPYGESLGSSESGLSFLDEGLRGHFHVIGNFFLNGARLYRSDWGSYVSVDPLNLLSNSSGSPHFGTSARSNAFRYLIPDFGNSYIFAANDPVNKYDRTGLNTEGQDVATCNRETLLQWDLIYDSFLSSRSMGPGDALTSIKEEATAGACGTVASDLVSKLNAIGSSCCDAKELWLTPVEFQITLPESIPEYLAYRMDWSPGDTVTIAIPHDIALGYCKSTFCSSTFFGEVLWSKMLRETLLTPFLSNESSLDPPKPGQWLRRIYDPWLGIPPIEFIGCSPDGF